MPESEEPIEESTDDSPAESIEPVDIPTDLPKPAVGRMSLYFRELQRLLDSEVISINSQELGQMVNVSPAVVRRDLSILGTIGRRGVGYDIAVLIGASGLCWDRLCSGMSCWWGSDLWVTPC